MSMRITYSQLLWFYKGDSWWTYVSLFHVCSGFTRETCDEHVNNIIIIIIHFIYKEQYPTNRPKCSTVNNQYTIQYTQYDSMDTTMSTVLQGNTMLHNNTGTSMLR